MIKQGVKGKIVFVASVLGLMSFVGYTPYTPGKFAIRGKCRPFIVSYAVQIN